MKLVVQRVRSAELCANGQPFCSISKGLLLLAGIETGDDENVLSWMAQKVLALRVFPDESGKMNLSVLDRGLQVMVVSNFTLAGDVSKGTRPNFMRAMKPEAATVLFDKFVDILRTSSELTIETGSFGAMMDIVCDLDGPVTIVIERASG